MKQSRKGAIVAFRTLKQNELLDNPLVVDNSVMMRWLFHDGSDVDQTFARNVLSAVHSQNLQVIVPYIWTCEAAFVVQFYCKRNKLPPSRCTSQLTWLFDLSTVIRGSETPANLYNLSHTYGISVYDAAYIILSFKQSCPIATLDKTIRKTSDKAKYRLFKP